MSFLRLKGGRQGTSAPIVYDLTPKPLLGAFRAGVNVSGPESTYTVNGTLYTNPYPDMAMLMHWASRGLGYIRLPLAWQKLQPTIGGAIDTAEFAKVSRVMAMCALLNMPVLMDPNHSTGDGAGRSEGAIGSSAVPTSAIADFLGKFVSLCRADPNYALVRGWDTTNEPHHMDAGDATNTSTPVSRAVVKDMLQRIINAIRATGDTKPIYCEADHYSGAWDWVDNNGALFLALVDPANALIASIHMYLDRDSSGSHFDWPTELTQVGDAPPGLAPNVNIGVQRLSKVVAWAYQNGVRLHVGECGWGWTSDGWRQAGQAVLDYLKACNIEFTYWSSGYNFTPALYGYCPDPYSAATGLRDWTPKGTSKPQSKLLQAYGTAPTAFPLFLPVDAQGNIVRRGTVGQTSGAFTFVMGGALTSALTVKPRARFVDGATADGTFTPAAIIIPAGTYVDQAYSFTYTPATAEPFQIDLADASGAALPVLFADDTNWVPQLAALGFSAATDSFTALGAAVVPVNVFGLRRLVSDYIGPAIRLQRDSDSAQKDFFFNRRGDLPRQAIQDWASSRSIKVVTVYDQGASVKHLTHVAGSTFATLTLINAAGYPDITHPAGAWYRFDSPVDGNTQQSILARVYDVNGGSPFLTQDNAYIGSFFPFRFAPSNYKVLNTTSVSPGRIANEWHHYAGTYSSGVTGGLVAYRDGVAVSTSTATGALVDQAGSISSLGYYAYSGSWAGSWQNVVILSVATTAAQTKAFSDADAAYYATALPDTLGAVGAAPVPQETAYPAPAGAWSPVANMKGFNLSGAENPYPSSSQYNYIYPEQREVNYAASKGFGMIRMPMLFRRLYPTAYALLDPAGRTDEPAPSGAPAGSRANLYMIKRALDMTYAKGIRLIIDNHQYGYIYDSRTGGDRNPGDGAEGTALFADAWSRVATLFKNYPNVVFGLMNEPVGCTPAQMAVAAKAALAAIRAAGANQLVLIAGGGNYDDAEPWASTQGTLYDTFNQPGWTGTNGDPADNFAFEGHKYFNAAGGGSTYGNDGQGTNYRNVTGAQLLGSMTTWCRQTNGGVARAKPFKAFLGEMGWTPDGATSISGQATPASGSAVPSVVSNSMLDFLSSNPDVWMGWTFFLGGSWAFSSTYKWGHVVPQNYGGDPSGYVDQPQMAQLVAHL